MAEEDGSGNINVEQQVNSAVNLTGSAAEGGSRNINLEHQVNTAVILTGIAKEVRAGPPLGSVDIGWNERTSSYLFRVALSGVCCSGGNLKFNIGPDGRVHIEGEVGGSEILKEMSGYQMQVQQLCPPGPFTVTFNLPGPVYPKLCSRNFRPNGILEVVVKARRARDCCHSQASSEAFVGCSEAQ